MICPICNNNDISSIYKGHLRTGSFGKKSTLKYNVYSCNTCSAKYIKNILDKEYYESTQYRQDYNNNIETENFYLEYDQNDTNKIYKIGLTKLRNKIVADFGTAAGTFLQAVNNICKYTIAIEPTEHFHDSLKNYSKYVFSYGIDLVKNNIKVDVATSFDVIEHVENPIEYLKEIYTSLNNEGMLYLKTPNFNDILHELIPDDYDNFNFRTAHLFYFDEDSIKYTLKQAGFTNFKITYVHDYDISNLIYWLKDSKPSGLNKTNLFDEEFNSMYKKYLERIGKASHIWVEAKK